MPDTDLKDFKDYLAEFETSVHFDSETCPICGINLSDNISVNQIPLIELQFENETVASRATSMLEEKGIKSIKSSSGKEKILIPEEKLDEAKSILKSE